MNGSKITFPPGIMLPDVLKQKSAEGLEKQLKEREDNSVCYNCGTHARKYVDPKTKRVACSFECYKTNLTK